jgi:Protein of unknown function (DUF1501)
MRSSRRQILKAALGTTQLALLGALGVQPRRARAGVDPSKPSRLLTIYVPGGWMPELFFSPLSAAQITARMPEPTIWVGEPCFFGPQHVRNIDGTGDDPDPDDPNLMRLRVPHLWDEAVLAAGGVDPQNTVTSPLGYAYRHDELWRHVSVIHGVDVGTAAHYSGYISLLSGVAGPTFRSPALQAWVAQGLANAYPHRPLPSVAVGGGPLGEPVHLGPVATPTAVNSTASLVNTLSERSDQAWLGLRDRSPRPDHGFDSSLTGGTLATNAIDDHVRARSRRLFGTVNRGTQAFYEDFYETYATVSRQLALDLVSVLEQTAGWENFVPAWANPNNGPGPSGVKFGYANGGDTGAQWADSFDLALRLFKADLCSAISLEALGAGGFYFDTHSGNIGAADQFVHVRAVLEAIGRLLHEMKQTPVGGGKSLLDDTLVLVFSEFSRTWPGSACDHWPSTSVLVAGGGTHGNRQLGGFDLEVPGYSPLGVSVPLIDEGGQSIARPPRTADIVFTALRTLGVDDFFIAGGPGEIVGVRA